MYYCIDKFEIVILKGGSFNNSFEF